MGLQDKITGRLKQAAGDLTGDEKLRSEGLREERKAEAEEELERANAAADAKAREVAALERQYDAFIDAQENRSLLTRDEDLPSGDELGAEFERFLAQQAEKKFDDDDQA